MTDFEAFSGLPVILRDLIETIRELLGR